MEKELIYAARAYLLQLIRGVLMTDSNNNKVYIICLPLLVDLEVACSSSWGFAILSRYIKSFVVRQSMTTKIQAIASYCCILGPCTGCLGLHQRVTNHICGLSLLGKKNTILACHTLRILNIIFCTLCARNFLRFQMVYVSEFWENHETSILPPNY